MTRPVGASFADWLSASQSNGEMGFGSGAVSLVLTIFIVILVVFRGGSPAQSQDTNGDIKVA
ncbi:hypothetical protein [Paenibacillus pectinilyticus]|uniref:hypothetical protein n=1 Tax=Paenibacillus pectinilyticus TaxID=512399 RepID=UPI001FC9AB92|nr:hypothetical protein [Paenibacillus pectinilyticus]